MAGIVHVYNLNSCAYEWVVYNLNSCAYEWVGHVIICMTGMMTTGLYIYVSQVC